MTKSKSTKRALLASVFALVVCFAMLVGSTFAWFTDSASTSVNTIKSGTLDVDLLGADGKTVVGKTLDFKKAADAPADEKILWEPGCTYELEPITIVNNGNLALKYKIILTGIKGDAPLNEAIEWTIQMDGTNADLSTFESYLLAKGEAGDKAVLTIKGHMKETAGNEYQDQAIEGISITVVATQYTHEYDSFTDQYDKEAGYPQTWDGTVADPADVAKAADGTYQVKTPAELAAVLNLAAAGSETTGDISVALPAGAEFNMNEKAWNSINVDGYHGKGVVTVEGNGAVVTGLTAPVFAGGFAGNSGIVIKNLTIADSNITSTDSTGLGAFIGSADSMTTITLENCKLENSTVKGNSGARAGGLIGWVSGYANTADGPVRTQVTVKNCRVINSTVESDGSVGAIIGHAGASDYTWVNIDDCTVTGCTLNSTDDGGWRVGAAVGTANNGHVVINNVAESGNTLTQTGKTAPAGQSNLYGRFVPSGTGTLVIDGTEIGG